MSRATNKASAERDHPLLLRADPGAVRRRGPLLRRRDRGQADGVLVHERQGHPQDPLGADRQGALDGYHPPSGYRSPEDLLVADGLVWTGETTSGRAVGVFTGRDPHTGEVKSEFPPDVDTYWFHHRCYRGKATDKYLLMSRTGIEFIDIRQAELDPAPLGPRRVPVRRHAGQRPDLRPAASLCLLPGGEAVRLQRPGPGAASGPRMPEDARPKTFAWRRARRTVEVPTPDAAVTNPDDWPTYRHDAARSGRASTAGARRPRGRPGRPSSAASSPARWSPTARSSWPRSTRTRSTPWTPPRASRSGASPPADGSIRRRRSTGPRPVRIGRRLGLLPAGRRRRAVPGGSARRRWTSV